LARRQNHGAHAYSICAAAARPTSSADLPPYALSANGVGDGRLRSGIGESVTWGIVQQYTAEEAQKDESIASPAGRPKRGMAMTSTGTMTGRGMICADVPSG